MNSIFCVFIQFTHDAFLAALRTQKIETTEITHIDETMELSESLFVLPYLCSAPSQDDAIDVTYAYATQIHPKTAPEAIWICSAPKNFLKKTLGKSLKEWTQCISAKVVWDGPIATRPNQEGILEASDLVFDFREAQWTQYLQNTYPRKKFVLPN